MFTTALAVLCAGTWFGAILFQSALVAPVVFGELDAEAARRVLRRLFPRFFVLGLALIGGALASVAFAPVPAGTRTTVAATLAAMLLAIGLALALVPAINAASDTGNSARFRALHGASVLLTLATMAGAVGVIIVLILGAGSS